MWKKTPKEAKGPGLSNDLKNNGKEEVPSYAKSVGSITYR